MLKQQILIIKLFSVFFTFLLCFGLNLSGQNNFKLTLIAQHFPNHDFEILSYYKGVASPVELITTDDNGNAQWSFPEKAQIGFYKIKLIQELSKEFLFIFNNENITIVFPDYDGEFIEFKQSKENEILNKYFKLQKDFGNIADLSFSFPENDDFYKNILAEYKIRYNKLNKFVDDLKKSKPDMFVTKYIKFEWREGLQPALGADIDIRKKFMTDNYFKGLDLSDTTILYFPSINDMIVNYFGLQILPTDSRDVIQTKYKYICDTLLNKTKNYPALNTFILDFIIEGMEQIGFEDIIAHIYENHIIEESCDDYDTPVISRVKKRIAQKKLLVKGTELPNVFVTDTNKNMVSLHDVKAEFIVLIFWSTKCTHCTKDIPEIYKWYRQYNLSKNYNDSYDMIKPLEIFAVSLDEDEDEWKTFIKENNLTWINVCDFQSWDGQAPSKYSIFATPTYIVMDINKKFIDAPANLELLKNVVKQ